MAPLLKDNVYRTIRHRVLTGRLGPGDRVSALALSKELGISQAPIREAVSLLASEGLLEQIPNAGSFVTAPDRADLEDLFELREWVEPEATAKAASCIDAEQLAELEQVCSRMRRLAHKLRESGAKTASDKLDEQHVATDFMFHMALIRASGNRRAMKFFVDHHVMSRLLSACQPRFDLREMARWYREHIRVFRAVRDGDAKLARRLTRAAIRRAGKVAMVLYDQQQRKIAAGSASKPRWVAALQETMHEIEEREAVIAQQIDGTEIERKP